VITLTVGIISLATRVGLSLSNRRQRLWLPTVFTGVTTAR